MYWRSRTTLIAITVVTFSSPFAQPLAAQEGTEALIGQELGSYPLETDFIVKAYADIDPKKGHHLFLTPFFAFEADKDGKLVVRLDDPDSGRRRITINLLAYPERQKEAIANRIRLDQRMLNSSRPFIEVQADDLITLGFKNLSIIEVSDEPKFTAIPPDGNGVTNQGKFELTADLPTSEAQAFKDALREGRRTIMFQVHASLNARKVQSTAIVTALRAEASDSEAYKTLTGNGTLFRAGVQGGVTIAPSEVTRNQRDRIEAVIGKELESKLIIDGTPKEVDWLKRQLDNFMTLAFKPDVIRQDFGQAAARLYAYDFKPSDLKPDQINKIVADVQDTFKQKKEEHEFKEAETSANVMFGIFSGTGNFRLKTDRLEEMMRDNGWKFELDSKTGVNVPRALKLYVVDLRSFHVTGSFSGLYEQAQRGLVVYQERFSTARRLDPSKPIVPEPWAEVADLRQKLDSRVPLGTMLPYFGKNLPEGGNYVWADGGSVWPDKDWVPDHLRKKKVPDMRQQLIGGAGQDVENGLAWDKGRTPAASTDPKTLGKIPPNPHFPNQDIYGVVSPFAGDALNSRDSFITASNSWTYARIPFINFGGLPLNNPESNPRHVMCRWIIRIR